MLPLVTKSIQTETIITQRVTKLLTTPKNVSFIMKSFICIGEQNNLQWIKDVNVGKPPHGGGAFEHSSVHFVMEDARGKKIS